MQQKHHRTETIIRILRQVDTDQTVESVCREHNIFKATFHRWKRKSGDMDIANAKRFKELEKENALPLGAITIIYPNNWGDMPRVNTSTLR